ncbi:flagellar hook-length control protein FliK [Colwellia sp. 20A7]|uniref:flagellar hook-length control protein FliK n=1 Tax=Colwellia sp. 20A7 TaxID=2689569 RepID=UPI00135843A9|nr:flagellar hook-length control protein FliK [Colwellia sp. 20A7]
MQQLNVLSMKVSQSIENKGDSDALISAPPKDKFSQHIDLQLSKIKKHTESENNPPNDGIVSNEEASSKTSKPAIEQKNINRDDKVQDRSEYYQAVVDDADSATNVQEVAAIGKQDEPDTNIVNADDKQIIDESELLMTFLTKVDQTLVTNASSDKFSPSVVNIGEISDEQKAKVEAKLLLKSSDLVADLSSVAKAVTSTADVSSDDIPKQEKVINSLISSSKSADIIKGSNTKETNIDNQVSSKLSIDGESSTVEELVADKLLSKDSTNNLGSDLAKLAEKNVVTNNKAIDQAGISPNGENKNTQKLVDTAIESQGTKQAETDNQSDKLQQNIVTTSKEANASNTSLPTKEILGTSTEVESKINEKLEKLIKADNGINVQKSDLAIAEADIAADSAKTQSTTIKNNDNLTSPVINKNVATNNSEQTLVEPDTEENTTAESEEELSARSTDKLLEQNKALDTDGNKGVNDKKNPAGDIAAPTNSSNFIGEASRATQDAYDRMDQQSSDVASLTGSAEVSQSQKTNTQLHQETISIFRRDFAEAVKDKVMLIISQKLQQFDITLDPPELGNVQVRVNLQGEQATVNFVVQNQQAKEAFEQNMHKLRDLLADQGVDVGDANVEQQSQQSDSEGNTESNQRNFSQNTADASDVIEHSLSARMSDPSTKVIDYYA